MNRNARPLSVTIIACLYVTVGVAGFAYHFGALRQHEADAVWIELTELVALLCGAFLFRGHNWARWLALAWMGFHVVISLLDGFHGLAVHCILFVVIAWVLLRPDAARYFRGADNQAA